MNVLTAATARAPVGVPEYRLLTVDWNDPAVVESLDGGATSDGPTLLRPRLPRHGGDNGHELTRLEMACRELAAARSEFPQDRRRLRSLRRRSRREWRGWLEDPTPRQSNGRWMRRAVDTDPFEHSLSNGRRVGPAVERRRSADRLVVGQSGNRAGMTIIS